MKIGHSEEKTASDHLEDAIEDLDQARHAAGEEIRETIDAALSRARQALDEVGDKIKEVADAD